VAGILQKARTDSSEATTKLRVTMNFFVGFNDNGRVDVHIMDGTAQFLILTPSPMVKTKSIIIGS
jgi:hypothetical protein